MPLLRICSITAAAAKAGLLEFAIGTAFGGAASLLAYLGQRFDWELAAGRRHDRRAADRLIIAALISGTVGYVLFVLGCVAEFCAIDM
jgi:hypothetical protein